MEHVIEAIRYFIHENGDRIAQAEEKFVSTTNGLYLTIIFCISGIALLFTVQMLINITIPSFKGIGLLFMGISLIAIILNMFYARHIFKVALAGTAWGIANGEVSGLEGGAKFLKEFFAFCFKLMAGIVVIFGIPSIIEFSWTSATICTIFGIFILFSTLSEKMGGKS